jgi:hypothetical protein
MARRYKKVLIRWKDKSSNVAKIAEVTFINDLVMTITQKDKEDDDLQHLYFVTVVDKNGCIICDYLDDGDNYSNELEEDYSCYLPLNRVEDLIIKLSKLILIK